MNQHAIAKEFSGSQPTPIPEHAADQHWEQTERKAAVSSSEIGYDREQGEQSDETRQLKSYDLNSLQFDTAHLHQLLDTIVDCIMDMNFERDGGRDTQLDRVSALVWIARDIAEQLSRKIECNFDEIGSTRAVMRALAAASATGVTGAAQAPEAAGAPRASEAHACEDELFLNELDAWRRAYDRSCDEDDVGPLWAAKIAITDRTMCRPANSAIALGVKLLVLTEYGEFDLDHERLKAVLEDARRIVGVPMPDALATFYARRGVSS